MSVLRAVFISPPPALSSQGGERVCWLAPPFTRAQQERRPQACPAGTADADFSSAHGTPPHDTSALTFKLDEPKQTPDGPCDHNDRPQVIGSRHHRLMPARPGIILDREHRLHVAPDPDDRYRQTEKCGQGDPSGK